ncbi:unnamed protein product [Rhizoctonia solani]|uniref:Uncharacterized protein n=1 Tax=Rhizoctonia solani TaxID=456999 RepID=A0A8H2WJ20_9AGAM|nr:unnamed protein product [Rhizoctonia solani]
MSLSPGTYTVYDTDSGRVLAYYFGPNRIGTWEHNHTENQKWRIKRYPGSPGYAIQNIMKTQKYLPDRMSGPYTIGVDECDAGIFELEHQFQDFYLIKLIGKSIYLDYPYLELDDRYTPVSFAEKSTFKGCFWRFEKISDDTGSALKRRPNDFASISSVPQPKTTVPQSSGSLYVDDAHLYTDMLFNMPRTPFTRDQRVAVLDWARKLGASNVPTIESFDECERRLGAPLRNTNNPGRNE